MRTWTGAETELICEATSLDGRNLLTGSLSRMTVGPRELLVAAALSAAAFFGVYAIAYEWHTGGQLDGRALLGFSVIRVSLATHAAHFFQSLCNPAPYLVICLVVLAIVLATRGVCARPRSSWSSPAPTLPPRRSSR